MAEHLEFTVGKALVWEALLGAVGETAELQHLLDGQVFAAGTDAADGVDEFLGGALLGQVAGGAGLEHAPGILILRMHAQDEHGQFRGVRLHQLEHVEAAGAGHGDVQHEGVPGLRADLLHHFAPVGGFAADLDVGGFLKNLAQSTAHDGMIVGNKQGQHGQRAASIRCATRPTVSGNDAEE